MRRKPSTIAAMSSSEIHAPSVSFETAMTTSVTPVAAAPIAFIVIARFAPGPPERRQCATMPSCDSVNARNAPIAKSGISRSVTPPKAMSSSAATTARKMMPGA